MPLQFIVIFIAMLPIFELRGALPLALGYFKFSIPEAYFWSVLGNMIPIFFLLWFWPTLAQVLMKKYKFFNKVFSWIFKRTKRKTDDKFRRYGELALIIFVAFPLPITGAWTGSVAAFLFNIPYWRALGLIFIGVLIAGLIVTLLTTGIISLI